jgi:hypothetical protein
VSPVSKKRKPAKRKKKNEQKGSQLTNKTVNYICLQCEEEEAIPLGVVRDFDRMDGGDPSVPPKFGCESCGGEMYPEYYKGVQGYEYRIENVRPNQADAERKESVTP